MADSSKNEKPHIEIATDEDWKERVKAEDAKRDAEQKAQPATKEQDEGDAAALPPASFPMLIQIFSTQAIVAMGLVPTPDGQTVHELSLARHFIDLLTVLEEKTKGNLTAEEAKFLENTVHELRMAFVEVSRQQAGGSAKAAGEKS